MTNRLSVAKTRAHELIRARRHAQPSSAPNVDVDAVVLYVEDDATHRRLRTRAESGVAGAGYVDNQAERYRCNNEIIYCLRSLYWCMPWLRKIHLVVADYQFPARCVDAARLQAISGTGTGPSLHVVRHSDFMPTKSLPTFNSQAIEACLCDIPDLAERFVYLNDDFFVGAPLEKSYFFTADAAAVPRYNLDRTFVPHRRKTHGMTMHAMAWCNNSMILDRVWGPLAKRQYPSHVAVPMLKSTWADLPTVALSRTMLSPFRTSSNIYCIGLCVYYNLYKQLGKQRLRNDTLFHDLCTGDAVEELFRFIQERMPSLFCINDKGYGDVERKMFIRCQREMFPLRTPWEPR